VFERLKREDGGADFARLAIPDQLHLALVFEKQEAIFLRQRLAFVDQLDEVALLGVGEFVFFRVVLASHDVRSVFQIGLREKQSQRVCVPV
jgi:hypothetical protein